MDYKLGDIFSFVSLLTHAYRKAICTANYSNLYGFVFHSSLAKEALLCYRKTGGMSRWGTYVCHMSITPLTHPYSSLWWGQYNALIADHMENNSTHSKHYYHTLHWGYVCHMSSIPVTCPYSANTLRSLITWRVISIPWKYSYGSWMEYIHIYCRIQDGCQ